MLEEHLNYRDFFMEDTLNRLIEQLERFNNFLEKKPLSNAEIEEEKDNIKDFIEMKQKLAILSKQISDILISDKKAQSKNLVDLHILLGDFVWFFENLQVQFRKIIKLYPYEE